MNVVMFDAFVDEMEKIALAVPGGREAIRKGGDLLRKGWNDGGTFGKILTVGGTAAMLPEALKKEDPTGKDRSRFERISRLAGSTVGGMMGSGVHPGVIGSLAGGVIGGVGGEAITGHAARFGERLVGRKVAPRSVSAPPPSMPPDAQT